ncbi:cbb3-type cytochrome oxidase assembly protein CcoS [Paracrocinitomix mangrovi]|uniref:cbb3-type cytochrome oxidase assembly protein CcoS n=1 Tax=Paracrocinitomix mangrovi TaxID=2862509 RepID=UPI001C8D9354|nr:cbb3-type cytochrome oxidase assembly protein CcoS [Paracrocinitomix mangrovi]UKN01492.1 cbb3-type cytochrome oxidase assembly protein CcoS [Paracrocinitomix mangrovi]
MGIIFVLLAISVSLALFFLVSFIWASKNGQFDDTYGPAVRMLFDSEDEDQTHQTSKTKKECN